MLAYRSQQRTILLASEIITFVVDTGILFSNMKSPSQDC